MQNESTAPVPPEAENLPSLPFIALKRQRYTLTHVHGAGGIGRVWLARDEQIGREVALKELRDEKARDPAQRAYFLREARITGQLEHPNIVPVYELAERPGNQQPFYVMRLVRGRTLHEAAADYHARRGQGTAGPLDLATLLQAFVAVCNAVAYAHARGVIHRDLKAENIALGEFGEVIVLDWGLAKQLANADGGLQNEESDTASPQSAIGNRQSAIPEETAHGQVLGTPACMAPEQAAGQTDRIGRHTDVYGLGAILYQVLTGHPPFTGDSTLEVLQRVRDEEPIRPRQHHRAVPPALEAVCLRALAKRPEDRYPSAAELAREVQRWLADEPVLTYREPLTARASRWARRHRTFVAGMAGLLLAAVAALTVGLVVLNEKNQAILEKNQAILERNQQIDQEKQATEKQLFTALGVLNQAAEEFMHYEKSLRHFPQLDSLGQKLLGLIMKAYFQDFESARQMPRVLERIANAYNRLGGVYAFLGWHAQAERAYTDVNSLLTEKVAEAPPNRESLEALALNHSQYGWFLLRRKRVPEAETQLRLAIEFQDRLVRQPFGTPEDRRQLARYHYDLGLRFHEHNRHADSEPHLRQAAAIQQELADKHLAQHDYRNQLAVYLYRLSIALRAMDRREEAERLVAQVLTMRRQLTQQHAKKVEYHHELALCLHHRGQSLHQDAATRQEARSLLEEAARCQHRVLRLSPFHLEYRQLLHDIYGEQTLVLLALGDHAAAARAADELSRALPESWGPCRRAAGVLVGCMTAADKDATLTADARRLRKEMYADRCVGLLRAAAERGFDQLPPLRENWRWAPMHAHPEFRQLTAGTP